MKKSKSIKNTCKNGLLLLLTLLLMLLTVLSWGGSLSDSATGSPLEGVAMRLRSLLPMGDAGYVQRVGETPAARPVALAMRAGGTLKGAFYQETTVSALAEETRPIWSDALSGFSSLTPADEDALQAALAGDCLMMRYEGALPLALVAGWFGGKSNVQTTVGTLVLTAEGRLFVRDGTGALFTAQTRIDEGSFAQSARTFSAPVCDWAASLPGDGLWPETLAPRQAAAFDVLAWGAPAFWTDEDHMETLLAAFRYSPFLRSYPEDGGQTRVFVTNDSSLRVRADGRVRWSATAWTGGLAAYQEEEGMNPLAAKVDYARVLLASALGAVNTDAAGVLLSVQEEGESVVLTFGLAAGGVLLQPLDEAARAVFVFQGRMLISARMLLRDVQPTGERLYVLPVRQASAAVPADARRGYAVAYEEQQDGRLLPVAYLQRGGVDDAVE